MMLFRIVSTTCTFRFEVEEILTKKRCKVEEISLHKSVVLFDSMKSPVYTILNVRFWELADMLEQSSDGLSGNCTRHRNSGHGVLMFLLKLSGISLKACIGKIGGFVVGGFDCGGDVML